MEDDEDSDISENVSEASSGEDSAEERRLKREEAAARRKKNVYVDPRLQEKQKTKGSSYSRGIL